MIRLINATLRAAFVRACVPLPLLARIVVVVGATWFLLDAGAASAQVRGVRPADVPGWWGQFNSRTSTCSPEHSAGPYCYIGDSGAEAQRQ